MSLVEILVAVFILAVAVIAIASTAAASLQSVRESRDRQHATQLASTVLEDLRARPFIDLVLNEAGVVTPPASIHVPTATPGCDVTEPDCEEVLSAAGGLVDHVRVLGDHTATTYLTVVDTLATESPQLRAIVLVRWDDVDGTHTVRQETLFAEATRGLSFPSFTVTPSDASANDLQGETICMDHIISNTGEQDSYSWNLFGRATSDGSLQDGTLQTRFVEEPDGSGGTTTVQRQGFEVPSTSEGAGWFGWARIAVPASSSTFEQLTDDDGDGRPESPVDVLALGDARIRFCYTPLDEAGSLEATSTNPTVVPRLYSQLDDSFTTESQGNELTNTLNVVDPLITLYLHEEVGSSKPMTRTAPTVSTADDAGDFDGDGIPGLHLDQQIVWSADFEALFSSPKDLTSASLTFDARSDDADLDDLVFDITLLKQDTAGTTTLAADSVTVTEVSDQWVSVSVSLQLSTSEFLENGDRVLVTMDCASGSTGECHIHYDRVEFPSAFAGEFQ